MEKFLQYLFDGLSDGSIYALIALGLVIIYRGTGHLNFAQGEMALIAAYVTYQMGEWGLPVGIALVVGVAAGFVIGAVTEVVLIRPIAKKSPFAVFIVTLGLFQGLNWLAGAVWGDQVLPNSAVSEQAKFPAVFPSESDDFVTVLDAAWEYKNLGVFVLVLVLAAGLFAIFKFTRLGLAMRAVASNTDSAKLVGIRTNSVLMVSWGMAAAIGGIGGVVLASLNQTVNLGLMFTVFLFGSAAATLGGFDSPVGAVVGGLAIGVILNMSAGYSQDWIGQEMKIAVAFLVILLVLLVKPSGLFGTAKVERV